MDKYILSEKPFEDNKEEITKKEAIRLLRNSYKNPKYVLENAERLFGNRISLQFTILTIIKNK